MDFLTASILSGVAYDYIKNGLTLSADLLKEKLKDWLISDDIAIAISKELENLELTDEYSERVIERKISESSQLIKLIEAVKPAHKGNTIVQNHHGAGDNVGRDKVVYK